MIERRRLGDIVAQAGVTKVMMICSLLSAGLGLFLFALWVEGPFYGLPRWVAWVDGIAAALAFVGALTGFARDMFAVPLWAIAGAGLCFAAAIGHAWRDNASATWLQLAVALVFFAMAAVIGGALQRRRHADLAGEHCDRRYEPMSFTIPAGRRRRRSSSRRSAAPARSARGRCAGRPRRSACRRRTRCGCVDLELTVEDQAPPARFERILAAPGLAREQHVTAAVDLDALREHGAAPPVDAELEDADGLVRSAAPFAVLPGDPSVHRHAHRIRPAGLRKESVNG